MAGVYAGKFDVVTDEIENFAHIAADSDMPWAGSPRFMEEALTHRQAQSGQKTPDNFASRKTKFFARFLKNRGEGGLGVLNPQYITSTTRYKNTRYKTCFLLIGPCFFTNGPPVLMILGSSSTRACCWVVIRNGGSAFEQLAVRICDRSLIAFVLTALIHLGRAPPPVANHDHGLKTAS